MIFRNSIYRKTALVLFLAAGICFFILRICDKNIPKASAQVELKDVQLSGDEVEFVVPENKVVAKGHVKVVKEDVTLLCDQLEYNRETQVAVASGHVVLIRTKERMVGEKLTFSFADMKGNFDNPRMAADPFYGVGEKVYKVEENHFRIENGYLTTSDFDNPEYRFAARKIDVYMGDKAVARNVRLMAGGIPIMYIPKFTQDLKRKEPAVLFTPGYDKDWGAFLLSKWLFQLNDNVRGALHLDYRQRKDLAEGVDLEYKSDRLGSGVIRTYYMNERNTTRRNFFDEQTGPTVERERFKAEWRHKWQVDQRTHAIWQYYKLSDSDFLKDYFEKEFDEDITPDSYALITRSLPTGTLSFRTDVRVNRFVSMVERLPELNYNLTTKQLGETGFYLKSNSTFSNLVKKTASPSEDRQKTMRLDTDNEVSYPFKFSIIEIRPFLGGRQTYYSRAVDSGDNGSVRGIFRTGSDLNTKFYRVFDITTKRWKLDINRLRHVVTPSIAYLYTHDPTVASTKFDQFDSVDALTREHTITFALENKLQTKRNDRSVDLVRMILSTDFNLKEDTQKGGFNKIESDIEITPYDWATFYFDSTYDTVKERLEDANFDLLFTGKNQKWFFNLSKRLITGPEGDDVITTEMGWSLNKKWRFEIYEQINTERGFLREQEYRLKRDLHSWIMQINFNSTRGEGDEIWLVFTLKAFPDMGFDFGTSFNRRKAGSQGASSN